MPQDVEDFLVFAFRDTSRAQEIVDAAREFSALSSVVLMGCSDGGCINLVGARMAGPRTGQDRLTALLAVAREFAPPLRELESICDETLVVQLPGTPAGIGIFTQLTKPGSVTLMIAVRESPELSMAEVTDRLRDVLSPSPVAVQSLPFTCTQPLTRTPAPPPAPMPPTTPLPSASSLPTASALPRRPRPTRTPPIIRRPLTPTDDDAIIAEMERQFG